MSNKNGYLAKKDAEKQATIRGTELIVKQYCIDTLLITLHEQHGWGYDRLMQLLDDWQATRIKYKDAVNPDPKDKKNETTYQQAKIDRMMVQIIRGKQELIPFEERYPTLRKIKV